MISGVHMKLTASPNGFLRMTEIDKELYLNEAQSIFFSVNISIHVN